MLFLVDFSFSQWLHKSPICNPFCFLFPHNLSFLCGFIFLLILYPLFLLFQKVSELIIKCFNLSCITCNQAGGFCAKTTSSVDLVKLPTLPSKSKDSYMISNCLWSSSVKVSSNFNILTQFVVEVIDSPSSLSLLCSLLRERKLSIGKPKLSANWSSCLNIGIPLSNLLPPKVIISVITTRFIFLTKVFSPIILHSLSSIFAFYYLQSSTRIIFLMHCS